MVDLNLTPTGYLPRVVDAQIGRYLDIFGAVEIAGTKWCGKTWCALHHARSASYIDDDYEIARADPALVTMGEQPHLIDEWQLVPRIWDTVRRAVDRGAPVRGGWILTGSSTPFARGNEDEGPRHSGAGRFGRVRMRPMSLAESGDSTVKVSLSGLLAGNFQPTTAPTDATLLAQLICRGGWPEALGLDATQAQTIAREYLRLYYTESVPHAGKNGDIASLLVGSIARNLGQSVTRKTLAADMSEMGEGDAACAASAGTITDYLTLLKASYLIEEVPGWVPATRSRKRLATKPKRYFADPSLAVAQLGMSPDALLRDWQTLGLAFENLCMRDLLVYASSLPDIGFEPVRYYRDDTGLEVDAVIELSDGRWAAFEVKLSEDKVEDGVASLKRLRRKLVERTGARVREPEFMAVVTGISTYARRVEDNIYVLPIRCLGA